MDKISYALGLSMANNLKASGFENLNMDEFMKAVSEVYNQQPTSMTSEEAKNLLNNYFAELQQKADEQNKKKGEAFLSENREFQQL